MCGLGLGICTADCCGVQSVTFANEIHSLLINTRT